MDAELTAHMGSMGDSLRLHIDWFDHNNNKQITDIEVYIRNQDKPRTLGVNINGVNVHIAQGV